MTAARRTSTAIRFKPELAAELHDLSDQYDLSVNWLVNRAVSQWLQWRDHTNPAAHVEVAAAPSPSL